MVTAIWNAGPFQKFRVYNSSLFHTGCWVLQRPARAAARGLQAAQIQVALGLSLKHLEHVKIALRAREVDEPTRLVLGVC